MLFRSIVTELAGEGTDQVYAFASFTLSANVENLTLLGSAPIDGTGNTLNNAITGNAVANALTGGAGSDTLNGGLGTDTADYSAATTAVTVNLTTGVASGALGTDALATVENVTGGTSPIVLPAPCPAVPVHLNSARYRLRPSPTVALSRMASSASSTLSSTSSTCLFT